MCSFIFRHEQKPLTLINPTLTRVISPIEMSTMIIQVGLSAVSTEKKRVNTEKLLLICNHFTTTTVRLKFSHRAATQKELANQLISE